MNRRSLLFAICWITGLTISLQGWEWNSTSLLLCSGGFILVSYLLHHDRGRLMGVGAILFILASAYGTWTLANNNSELPINEPEYSVLGSIVSPVEVDGDRVRFIIRTEEEGEKIAVSIRLASQEEQATAHQWRRGNQALIKGELTLPPSARNFGQFDYRLYLYNQKVHRMILVKGLDSMEVTSNHSWSRSTMLSWLDRIRSNMATSISKLYPQHQSGFMSSMLIGLKDNMNEELFSSFSQLGLTHIIAISGLHVAIVVGGWMGLLRLLRVTRETNISSVMIFIPIYVMISGGSPSVVRAGIMALIALYAARRNWLKDGLNIVAVTAILMTMWNPYYIYDVSFQLSFAVTAGLIIATPVVARWIRLGPNWLNGTIAVTLVAQAISFPLTIYYFNQFSLISGLANLLLVPVFSLIVLPLGYISLIIYYAFPPVALWIARLAYWCNEGCFWLMDQLDAINMAKIIWTSPPLSWIAIYLGLLLSIVWSAGVLKEVDKILFPRLARFAKRTMQVSALLGIILLSLGYGFLSRDGLATVSFLDVGQGDASIIRTPSNRVILVDGGGTLNFLKAGEEWRIRQDPYEIGEDLLVPLLKKRGISQIDDLIITHSDMDHIGGLQAVIEEIPVKRILFNGTFRANSYTEKLFETAVGLGIPLYPVREGRELHVDEHTRLNFLYPVMVDELSESIPQVDDQNGISVVFKLTMYDSTFLFTGDMEAAAEREVLARIVELRGGDVLENVDEKDDHAAATTAATAADEKSVDVLKVGHHGSKTSTTESWLGLWQPNIAVISVGERNIYRHPSPEVIDRLVRHNVKILRTDQNGEVQMRVSESGIKKRVYVGAGE